jgi:hypothetical protein
LVIEARQSAAKDGELPLAAASAPAAFMRSRLDIFIANSLSNEFRLSGFSGPENSRAEISAR